MGSIPVGSTKQKGTFSGAFLFGLFARKRPVGSRERSEALPRGPLQGFRLIPAGLFFVWSFSLFAPYLDKST